MRSGADPARRVAAEVVLAVDVDGAYANLRLPQTLRSAGITGRDAAFATELTYGALRWQGVLDEVASSASGRAVEGLDPEVRAVVRLGAYQLLHMRVPSHAAVSASVDLVRAVGAMRAAGFVNAVLRRVAERDWAGWVDALAPAAAVDALGRLAFANGYPRWIAAALLDALGGDVGELGAALAVDRPLTHLVARPGRMTRAELLAEAGSGAVLGRWSPYAVVLPGGDPGGLASVRAGRAAVQDEGSQLAALALADAVLEGPDVRWLDTCAGPGGKAALLSGIGAERGARVLAADRAAHRAKLAYDALAGGPPSLVVTADGTAPAWRAGTFDRVLVDAPCSGLGALRRRPEVRWRRTPADVDALVPLQVELLEAAIQAARPGGLVAYVTCSPHPAETRGVVETVRGRVDGLSVVPVGAPWASDVSGFGQLWPHRHETDAMFVAVLRRASAAAL